MLKLSSCLLAIILCGCANYIDSIVSPPTPAQVSDYASQVGTLSVEDIMADGRVYKRKMYSSEYLLASVNYTNLKCNDFFDKLSCYQQDSSFIDKVLSASITASTPLMAAYGVFASAIAATGTSIAYAQNINNFASEIYTFASYSA